LHITYWIFATIDCVTLTYVQKTTYSQSTAEVTMVVRPDFGRIGLLWIEILGSDFAFPAQHRKSICACFTAVRRTICLDTNSKWCFFRLARLAEQKMKSVHSQSSAGPRINSTFSKPRSSSAA
jgi:hypothetical protein